MRLTSERTARIARLITKAWCARTRASSNTHAGRSRSSYRSDTRTQPVSHSSRSRDQWFLLMQANVGLVLHLLRETPRKLGPVYTTTCRQGPRLGLMGQQHKKSTGPPVATSTGPSTARLARCHCGARAARKGRRKKFRHGFSVVDGHWADQGTENSRWRSGDAWAEFSEKDVFVALLALSCRSACEDFQSGLSPG